MSRRLTFASMLTRAERAERDALARLNFAETFKTPRETKPNLMRPQTALPGLRGAAPGHGAGGVTAASRTAPVKERSSEMHSEEAINAVVQSEAAQARLLTRLWFMRRGCTRSVKRRREVEAEQKAPAPPDSPNRVITAASSPAQARGSRIETTV